MFLIRFQIYHKLKCENINHTQKYIDGNILERIPFEISLIQLHTDLCDIFWTFAYYKDNWQNLDYLDMRSRLCKCDILTILFEPENADF